MHRVHVFALGGCLYSRHMIRAIGALLYRLSDLLMQSDDGLEKRRSKIVAHVFTSIPNAFARCWSAARSARHASFHCSVSGSCAASSSRAITGEGRAYIFSLHAVSPYTMRSRNSSRSCVTCSSCLHSVIASAIRSSLASSSLRSVTM